MEDQNEKILEMENKIIMQSEEPKYKQILRNAFDKF